MSAWASASPNGLFGSAAAKRRLPWPRLAPTSRLICCAGVSPIVHTPGSARAGSLVKASTGTPAALAIGATAAVSPAVSGPMISRSPCWIAIRAASAAPAGVPPVSSASSAGALATSSATWAAFTIAWPSAAPLPDFSGTRIATLGGGAAG